MLRTKVDDVRDARDVSRSELPRCGARVPVFHCWRPSRQFRVRALPSLRTKLDQKRRESSTHGEARFGLRANGPCAVLGPVLARAFARFALILRLLVTRRSFLGPASFRSLRTRLRLLAPAAAALHQVPRAADRSRGAWRCDESRQWWLGDRSVRYCPDPEQCPSHEGIDAQVGPGEKLID